MKSIEERLKENDEALIDGLVPVDGYLGRSLEICEDNPLALRLEGFDDPVILATTREYAYQIRAAWNTTIGLVLIPGHSLATDLRSALPLVEDQEALSRRNLADTEDPALKARFEIIAKRFRDQADRIRNLIGLPRR